ncbi:hypothetical protein GEMRC1_011004 [Eukaryota sp. GEM-RC1]
MTIPSTTLHGLSLAELYDNYAAWFNTWSVSQSVDISESSQFESELCDRLNTIGAGILNSVNPSDQWRAVASGFTQSIRFKFSKSLTSLVEYELNTGPLNHNNSGPPSESLRSAVKFRAHLLFFLNSLLDLSVNPNNQEVLSTFLSNIELFFAQSESEFHAMKKVGELTDYERYHQAQCLLKVNFLAMELLNPLKKLLDQEPCTNCSSTTLRNFLRNSFAHHTSDVSCFDNKFYVKLHNYNLGTKVHSDLVLPIDFFLSLYDSSFQYYAVSGSWKW